MDATPRAGCIYVFGAFRLDQQRRVLTHHGSSVPLTSRPFDALLCLVQNHDRLVERRELEQAIWPGRAVEDGNLQKAIAAVRRALEAREPGESFIVTSAGRGFRFTMNVTRESAVTDQTATAAPSHRWPGTPMIWASMAIATVVAVAGTFVAYRPIATKKAALAHAERRLAPPPHSVAVMAFANLSGDPGREYFSDGLSEELINTLGSIPGLRVAAPLSSFSFKSKPTPIGSIAQDLNVGAILQGSVRQQGKTIRVTARLIDGQSGYMIWSSQYDRDPGDLFRVQGEIATAVATALQVSMVGDDPATFTAGGTSNPAAFEAYLRGMKLHNERTSDSIRQARAYFDAALAADPHYALAHVRRVSCLIMIAQGRGDPNPGDGDMKSIMAAALTEARLAVSLAPNLGAAHTILGNALEISGDFINAGLEHTRALQLAPGDPWVNTMYGMYQSMVGHADLARQAAQRGADIDPLSPEAYWNLAQVLILGRQPALGLTALRHAEQLGMSGAPVIRLRAMAELESGSAADARRDCDASADDDLERCVAIADHMLGRQAEAERALAKMRAQMGDEGALDYVRVYAQWGQPEQALHWLDVAGAQRQEGLIELRLDPWFDPIRNTDRFKAVEKSMNFPP